MNPIIAPGLPCLPRATRQRLEGRVEIRARPGTTYRDIRTLRSVRFGAGEASIRLDGGSLDRTIRRFSPTFRVLRAHSSAARGAEVGRDHEGWDDLEERTGLSRTYRVDVAPETDLDGLVAALRSIEGVESASPHYLCQTPFSAAAAEPLPGDRRVFQRVGAAKALKMEPGDATVIVAIIDSGVTSEHPELMDRVRPGANTVDLVKELMSRGLRYAGPEGTVHDASDVLGHGTGCASIIAARGLKVHPGLGGAAQVLPMRALARIQQVGRKEPVAVGAIPDINAAVKLAVDLGAKVLNLSFGTPATALRKDDPIPHAAVIDYAMQRGCVLVAASGNRGDDTRYYPAALTGVIAVGSVDSRKRPSKFSCRGQHVALCAPGEKVPCASLQGYQQNTGTSFAAPFVAAAAALLVARAHRTALPLDSYRVREILMKSAAPFSKYADVRGCGAGILNMPAALRLLDQTDRGPPGFELFPGWTAPGDQVPPSPKRADLRDLFSPLTKGRHP